MEFSDLDWMNIVTPINVPKLRKYLQLSQYDRQKSQHLIDGFSNGFSIGYQGPQDRRDQANNLPLRVGDETELWDKVMKEVKENRYAGPFENPPTEYFIQSPIGLVPKAGGKTRLIFHLSYDFEPNEKQKSVNYHTPTDICKVKYNDLDNAVKKCLELLNYVGG